MFTMGSIQCFAVLVAAMCISFSSSKLLRGRRVDSLTALAMEAKGCSSQCTGDVCQLFCDEDDETVKALAMTDGAPEKCVCNIDGDQCVCTEACSDDVKFETCTELLGECECSRSSASYCECFGYCHTPDARKDACETAFGCGWTGSWCDVVTKLKFNEDTENMEASFSDEEGDDSGSEGSREKNDVQSQAWDTVPTAEHPREVV
eukprot:TRINITY_DN3393_c0_g1_i1.p1 TRINITY_DN3393_c0_g1~~TRINITY_DN3393_c0_g1_i1.p1  ORF type:complete len:205 (+),score=42.20 TRINITY_DN3393_c0_g1_i1:100-714(+)